MWLTLAWLTELAYAVLLLVCIRRGAIWRAPFFCLYLLLFLIRLPIWVHAIQHPPGLGWLPYFEPVLIGAKLCMFSEAFGLATESLELRERRFILGLIGCCAAIAVLIAMGLPNGLYLAIRSYSNIALAMASLVGLGCFWLAPFRICPRLQGHCAILAIYFANLAIAGLLPVRSEHSWHAINGAYFAGSLICCALWLNYGLTRRMVRTISSTSVSR